MVRTPVASAAGKGDMTECYWPRPWWLLVGGLLFLLAWTRTYGYSGIRSLRGLTFQVARHEQTLSFTRPTQPGDRCDGEGSFTIQAFPGFIAVTDEGLLFTASASSVVEWQLQGRCKEAVIFSFPEIVVPWGNAWVTLETEQIALGSPDGLAASIFPQEGGLYTWTGQTFLPQAGQTFLLPWWREASTALGLWSQEEMGNGVVRVWGSELSWGVLGQTLIAGTPSPSAVIASLGCLSQSGLFWPQSEHPCSVTSEIFRSHQNGKSWIVRGDVVEPVQILVARKPENLGEVIISEVMWMGTLTPTGRDDYDEWLELYNTTESTLDLVGCSFSGAAEGGGTLKIFSSFLIPARSFVVIGRRSGKYTQLARAPDLELSGLRLSNVQAGMQLFSQQGRVLDSLPSGSWEAGKNEVTLGYRASAQRKRFMQPGNTWTNWGQCSDISTERCQYVTQASWKSTEVKNLASPWLDTVL